MAHHAANLEAMPLELYFNAISCMATLEDVRATIRAGPAALNALLTGRERIYAVVLKTCLAPEVYRELLDLGLVFLDRVARSSLADRRELMRSAFNIFLEPHHVSYPWSHWDDAVYERCKAVGRTVKSH